MGSQKANSIDQCTCEPPPYFNPDSGTLPSVKDFIRSLNAIGRSLPHQAKIESSVGAAVDTVAGAHLTAECVPHALKERDGSCVSAARVIVRLAELRVNCDQYPGTPTDIRRLLQLASRRDALTEQLLRPCKTHLGRFIACNDCSHYLVVCSRKNLVKASFSCQ